MIFVLFLMGVSSIREFALPLMVGIVCGTYSSVCVTGALWYVMTISKQKKIAQEKAESKEAQKAEKAAKKEAKEKTQP